MATNINFKEIFAKDMCFVTINSLLFNKCFSHNLFLKMTISYCSYPTSAFSPLKLRSPVCLKNIGQYCRF